MSGNEPLGVERGAAALVAGDGGEERPVPPAGTDEEPHVLELTMTDGAADRRELWAAGDVSVSLAVVEIGPAATGGAAEVPVERVGSPDDLTGIGIALNSALGSWRDAEELLCRFDSVSVLLQYVDTQTAFKFLHTVVGRLRNAGARSLFYVDPTLHDEQTVATVAAAFDGGIR